MGRSFAPVALTVLTALLTTAPAAAAAQLAARQVAGGDEEAGEGVKGGESWHYR